jgi:hypothetical protein
MLLVVDSLNAPFNALPVHGKAINEPSKGPRARMLIRTDFSAGMLALL